MSCGDNTQIEKDAERNSVDRFNDSDENDDEMVSL